MTNRSAVVDTNVLMAANRRSEQVTIECALTCIDRLEEIRKGGLLALDSGGEILAEYGRRCEFRGSPGLGDEFFRWAFENQYVLCALIDLTPHDERVFVEFPTTDGLQLFDRSDRKFVATALACDPPALIFNAVDSDWSESADGLREAGVDVVELCPDCLRSEHRPRRGHVAR